MARINGSTSQEALSRLVALSPRGINVGDEVSTPAASFKVIALQQWRMQGGSRSIGLVWGSRCRRCKTPWSQLTETRPTALASECPACDVVGAKVATLDEVLVAELVGAAISGFGLPKQRGRMENHVLEVIATLDPDMQAIPVGDLISKAAGVLDPPAPGKRDTRRQHVARAIENLCKEKDGEISKRGDLIILYR